MSNGLLVSAGVSAALDAEACKDWGFNSFALVEAAGRASARVFMEAYPGFFPGKGSSGPGRGPGITVIAGSGNNGADAMVMLRYWLLNGFVQASASALIVNRMPSGGDIDARSGSIKSLDKMKVPVFAWEAGNPAALTDMLASADIIVDGIAGTGLKGALRASALEMVSAVNLARERRAPAVPGEAGLFVVSVDVPSGNSDEWKPGMPIVRADLTLAIEPQKYCVYTPAARPYAGVILPVGGVFPGELSARREGIELIDWESARRKITPVRPDVYKNERGAVEIHAGSQGASGAARIAARGAQASGAGLVRLVTDNEIYPVLASCMAGVMVAPEESRGLHKKDNASGGFRADAVLLGPGWGKGPERLPILEAALALEKAGTPLVLDADAIQLAAGRIFNGNAILTPHPGEFSGYSGIDRDELLYRPAPVLRELAEKRRAFIIFKGHVTTIAAPDGRLGVVDGMTPGLAAGGSGDLLAGLCSGIAARMRKENPRFDLFRCAAAAVALLVAAGQSRGIRNRFTDPLEIADRAADIAGAAWLGREGPGGGFYE